MKHKIICGDTIKALQSIENESVDIVLTSPPYWGLRDYGTDGQIGLEFTLGEYHAKLLKVTAELKRVLKPTGVMFWNHGDSYGGSGNASGHTEETTNCGKRTSEYGATKRHTVGYKSKCMLMQNERLIIKMIDEQGWILRNRIIWNKPNGMPSSVQDRFSNKYEPVYMLTKNKKYWFDLDAVREEHKESSLQRNNYQWNSKQRTHSPNEKRGEDNREAGKLIILSGKNPGDCWNINTQPFSEAHFAVFPEKLCEKPILAGCPAEVCKHCGMARVRITKTIPMKIKRSDWGEKAGNRTASSGTMLSPPESKTIGWTNCPCSGKNKYEPGIVLDPFCGSGTVGMVAEKLGRNSILIDIKKDYCEMCYKRLLPFIQQQKWNRKPSAIKKVGF